MEENIKTEKINFELSVECQSVNERYQKNNRNYQKFLEDKEKQLEGFLEKKREATLKNQKLIRDIGTLNDRLTFLEKEIKILKEENELFCANIDDEFYQKQTELKNERIQNLESKIEELMSENKKLSNENLERQEKINISEKILGNRNNGLHCKIGNLEQQISTQVDEIAKKDEKLSYLWFINDKKSTQIQSMQKKIEDLFVKFQESNYLHENSEYKENIAHVMLKNKFEVSTSCIFCLLKYFFFSLIAPQIFVIKAAPLYIPILSLCIYIYIYIYIYISYRNGCEIFTK